MQYTYEQVLSLSPSPNNAKNGKQLASSTKWSNHGATERMVWGECKGSGKNPYQTVIDLNTPAFKCSCPSREFPCKHGMGLFLLYVSKADYFTDNTPPTWAEEWLNKRLQTEERKQAKLEEKTPEQIAKSEAEKSKREEKRFQNIDTGLVDLQKWIEDIVRQGLGNLSTSDYQFWESQAARMVDAQAPGIGNLIREIPTFFTKNQWMESVLERLAEIYLLISAYQNKEHLEPLLQIDILSLVGINQKKEEILALEGVKDLWQVLSHEEIENENLITHRSWLLGKNTGKYALLLDFSFGNQRFLNPYMAGMCIEAELVFYPSNFPVRALVKNRNEETTPQSLSHVQGFDTFQSFLTQFAQDLHLNPLQWNYPCLINQVRPVMINDQLFLKDIENYEIPLVPHDMKKWKILSISGGHPITLFGNWNQNELAPLSLVAEGRFYSVG
jgi:hypothetical protein